MDIFMPVYSTDAQIEKICSLQIPDLMEHMPYGSWFEHSLRRERQEWRFTLRCNSVLKQFFISALGQTPMEAFLIAKHNLLTQMKEWHQTRFQTEEEGSHPQSLPPRPQDVSSPRFLIVDDDLDLALAMQVALEKLGCQTEVATQHEDLHRKIAEGDVDFILLDWKLNGEVTADQVVEKASRLISTFSDLRLKFAGHRPHIVTYSVLPPNEVWLPEVGHQWFDHLDHWQKPMPFEEIIRRASGLLELSAQGKETA